MKEEGRMKKVRMSHPRLGGREIEVPASAVRVHEKSGWQRAEEPPRSTGTRRTRSADEKKQEN